VLLSIAGFLGSGGGVEAVLFYATADPEHNTTAPSGALSGSGWNLQGRWGSYLGTPVGPSHFLTARHVGGAVGQRFVLNGESYTALAFHDHAESDLRLVQICGQLSEFAALYTSRDEVGKALVVFGRGTRRGAEVTSSGPVGMRSHGWRWGTGDGRLRWGANVVDAIVSGDELFHAQAGQMLWAGFDREGVLDECHLSAGDSGGAVFLFEEGIWKLAGLNYAVDGPYRLGIEEPGFDAVIFDEGGLYKRTKENWLLVPALPQLQPGGFYATRISSHAAWIQSVLKSAPVDSVPVIQSATDLSGPYEDELEAVADPALRIITVRTPDGTRFYRLRACESLRVTRVRQEGGGLVVAYEVLTVN
jgi:hypothetical protein